jgi:hypothetical protein
MKLKHILLLSVLLRVAAALYLGNDVVALPGTSDQVSYHNLAVRVLDGHGFSFGEAWWPITDANAPTAHWSFLYTGYLILVYALFGVNPVVARIIQAVIVGVLHPYLAFKLTQQVLGIHQLAPLNAHFSSFFAQNAPLLAAGVTAIYIYFIYYAAALMTEPFYISALLGSLSVAIVLSQKLSERDYWKTALGLGFLLLATVLFRQLFMLILPFIYFWVLGVNWRNGVWQQWFVSGFIGAGVVIAGILPFTYYNYTRFDRFVLLNTNAGYAFYFGNHPNYGDTFIPASQMGETYQTWIPDELRHLDEAALDNALMAEAFTFITADPGRYLRLSLSRVAGYFRFLPEANSSLLSNLSRVGSFGVFMPFMLYGVLRPLIPWRRSVRITAEMGLLYLFMLVYIGIHVLTWTQVRYRLPVDAVLVIFASFALAELAEWVFGRRSLVASTNRYSLFTNDQ